ncbi:MAG: very short patch repair endonuclease [Bacteroidales bacterium]|nr:very short patch repair endonuclease [Bacteroidales bacterium]
MDRLSPTQRRRCMQHNKSKNTSIEVRLGRAMWHRGLRYRKCAKDVLGHPDFCFKGKKVAVFCDGEFWHGRHWETAKLRIKSRRDYWIPKIERNQQRDKEITEALERAGWTVLRFWESDIRKHLDDCVGRVEAALNGVRVARGYQQEENWREWLAAEDDIEYE